jgi:glutamate-1-semialdehyde 2,1-aminomutase
MAPDLTADLFERARISIPGGVNSPVRSFQKVGAPPLFIERAQGPHVYDHVGQRYVDYVMSWGVHILGHSRPEVVEAICRAAERGTSFGLCTEAEIELAELIEEAFPSIELLRLVNSGTEAVMSAVRLARGCTGRSKIIKFEGCYHGHSDGLLVRGGSGLATFGISDSAGVPPSFARETLLARYNDLASVERLASEYSEEVACILVEPVAGNMGVVLPRTGFLEGLRALADRMGALLIFDEVITGFRVCFGGAQERYGVQADVTCLGKIIGGGLPIGAFGGSREIMERLAPTGDVYQAGTLSGNPIAVAAGLAALKVLRDGPPYEVLDQQGSRLEEAVKAAAQAAGVPVCFARSGSMFTIFFTEEPVRDYASACMADADRYGELFRALLKSGVLIPPSALEASFISTAHGEEAMGKTVEAFASALSWIASKSQAGHQ